MSTDPAPAGGGEPADALDAVWSGDPAHPPVILIHGSMDRSAGMLRLSRRLDRNFHVQRYDRRGYGRSAECPPPFDVPAHVADLDDLVVRAAHEHGSPVRVFGHSFGGNVALAVAARRPDEVSAVAVYETPLSWMPWWPGNTAGAAAAGASDPADAAEAFMRRLIGDAVWERLPAATRRERRAEGATMVAELTSLRSAAPWDPASIEASVTAIVGEQGRPHHRRGMQHLAEAIAGSELVTLADAGHAAPNTHADALAEVLVGAWLSASSGD